MKKQGDVLKQNTPFTRKNEVRVWQEEKTKKS